MATPLEDYTPPEVGRPPSYPWHVWLDQKQWEIKQGTDFKCEMHSMEGLIRRTASNYNLKVKIHRKDETTFVIQARPLSAKK